MEPGRGGRAGWWRRAAEAWGPGFLLSFAALIDVGRHSGGGHHFLDRNHVRPKVLDRFASPESKGKAPIAAARACR